MQSGEDALAFESVRLRTGWTFLWTLALKPAHEHSSWRFQIADYVGLSRRPLVEKRQSKAVQPRIETSMCTLSFRSVVFEVGLDIFEFALSRQHHKEASHERSNEFLFGFKTPTK